MPALKTYRLFISHAWQYHSDYYRLVEMLKEANYFVWYNYSVPRHDPKDVNNKKALAEALQNQMRPTNCVLIVSGMYAAYREWIQYEIDLAAHWGKPVIGIRPRGSERSANGSQLSRRRNGGVVYTIHRRRNQEARVVNQHEQNAEHTESLLALHKLYVEMANAVSQRRDSTNRFLLTLATTPVALLVLASRGNQDIFSNPLAMVSSGLVGLAVSCAWGAEPRDVP